MDDIFPRLEGNLLALMSEGCKIDQLITFVRGGGGDFDCQLSLAIENERDGRIP